MEWDEVARGSFIRKLNPQDVEACLVSGGLEKIRYSTIGSFLSQHSPSFPAAHRPRTPWPPQPSSAELAKGESLRLHKGK